MALTYGRENLSERTALKVQSRSPHSGQSPVLCFTATTSPEIFNETHCSELINYACLTSDLIQLDLIKSAWFVYWWFYTLSCLFMRQCDVVFMFTVFCFGGGGYLGPGSSDWCWPPLWHNLLGAGNLIFDMLIKDAWYCSKVLDTLDVFRFFSITISPIGRHLIILLQQEY